MPRCFQLTKKGSESPSNLTEIDAEICGLLEQPVDEVHWCKLHKEVPSWANWYDTIGLRLACGTPLTGTSESGNTLDDFGAIKEGEEYTEMDLEIMANMRKVVAYLRENYTSTAWWQSK